jgi:hypothetical protein
MQAKSKIANDRNIFGGDMILKNILSRLKTAGLRKAKFVESKIIQETIVGIYTLTLHPVRSGDHGLLFLRYLSFAGELSERWIRMF